MRWMFYLLVDDIEFEIEQNHLRLSRTSVLANGESLLLGWLEAVIEMMWATDLEKFLGDSNTVIGPLTTFASRKTL